VITGNGEWETCYPLLYLIEHFTVKLCT